MNQASAQSKAKTTSSLFSLCLGSAFISISHCLLLTDVRTVPCDEPCGHQTSNFIPMERARSCYCYDNIQFHKSCALPDCYLDPPLPPDPSPKGILWIILPPLSPVHNVPYSGLQYGAKDNDVPCVPDGSVFLLQSTYSYIQHSSYCWDSLDKFVRLKEAWLCPVISLWERASHGYKPVIMANYCVHSYCVRYPTTCYGVYYILSMSFTTFINPKTCPTIKRKKRWH